MPAIELPPLTDAHREAIRKLRFVSPLLGRVRAIGNIRYLHIARVLCPTAAMTEAERLKSGAADRAAVASARRYRRASDPDIYEWELTFSHPDAVAYICDLVDGRTAP